ncbi:hypothetical protein BIY26_09520 [Brenneria goodwinii]|uniref:Tape measure protein N-terminal domain-containing protein n=1 Tax=Brenneria goodwinii TaxID=1109412 RepID=A0AAE8ETE2_9GAMM|nr:tape measure protein [Brenneria goodwinii]ATA23539.1 hypothetical protein AWC36_05145 [Brenneria goodwinii]RLM25247.1 hypothetical protein BIY26_09520 [Brenneria goodwinii]
MATLRELIIKISANSTSYQSEIARASRMGANYYKTMESSADRHSTAIKRNQLALKELTSQFQSTQAMATRALGAIGGAFAVGGMISTADEWGQISSRIKMATESGAEYGVVQQRLMEISDRTYKSINEQAELFIRSSNAMKELGYSTSGTIDFIDSISSALTINAASAQKGESAINALSKSMVAGKVSGDNWNTVMEVMPTVIGDIARYLNITETEVKKLAAAGKLSMGQFADAVIAARTENAKLAEDMPTTVGDAITKLSNHWKAYIGDANSATGTTQAMADAIGLAADNIDLLATAGAALAGGVAAKYLLTMANNGKNAAKEILSARASQIALADAQLQATQTLQYKATIERRAAQAAAESAVGASNQRLATLALVQARNKETVAINATAVAQTRLNAATNVWRGLGSGLLGILGGPVGLAVTAASVAAGFLLMHDSGEQVKESLINMQQPVASLVEQYRALGDVQKTSALHELNKKLSESDEALRKSTDTLRDYAEALVTTWVGGSEYSSPVPVISSDDQQSLDTFIRSLGEIEGSAGGIKNVEGYLQANVNAFADSARLTDDQRDRLQNLTLAYVQGRIKVEEYTEKLREVTSVTQDAAAANRQLSASLSIDFSKQLTSANLALDVSALAAKGATKEADLLRGAYAAAGEQASALAPEIQKIVAAGGNIDVSPGLEGVRDWVQIQVKIQENNERAKEFASSIKTGASETKKLGEAYDKLIQQQRQQIALHGQDSELAKTRYQLANSELMVLSESQKAVIERNATELDRLNTLDKYKSLMEQLRTPEEQVLSVTKERLELLKAATPAAEEYREALDKISKSTVSEAPKFGGLDASIGGASGELIRVADAEKELQKWHDTQLAMQEKLLKEQEGYEQAYADRIVEIEQKTADKRQSIQSAYTSASLSMISTLTSDAASLLSTMGEEGSAAYKAMFIASKAASIAQAIINTEEAATKAMAQGGTLFGLPMATVIRGAGYASVALMASTTIAGMAHDGIDNVPREGTWLLDRGERVVDARTNADLKGYLSSKLTSAGDSATTNNGGNVIIHQNISVSGSGDKALASAMEQAANKGATDGASLARQQLLQDFQTRGQARRLLGV